MSEEVELATKAGRAAVHDAAAGAESAATAPPSPGADVVDAELGEAEHDAAVRERKMRIEDVLEGGNFTRVMTLLTLFALFGDDVRLAACEKAADDVFYGISCVALFAFSMEMCLAVYARPHYFNGFYFWLDFASTLSLIPDIGWLWEPLTGTGESSGSATALKAGRASRAGSKAGRIVRIVRLVRMIRMVKLYKMHAGEQDVEAMQASLEPTKVGKKLQEMTTRRLIVLVLTMILVLPWFDGGLDDDYNQYADLGLLNLHRLPQDYNTSFDYTVSEAFFKEQVQLYARDAGYLIYLEVCSEGCPRSYPVETTNEWLAEMRFQDVDGNGDTDTSSDYTLSYNPLNSWRYSADVLPSVDHVEDQFRDNEFQGFEVDYCFDEPEQAGVASSTGCVSKAFFSVKDEVEGDAELNIVKTLFVMVILAGGCYRFSTDAEVLVIGPIERMLDLVKKLAENPLASTTQTEPMLEEDKAMRRQRYETALLEQTLAKVGALLQVGFGAAGAEIIGKNMNVGSGEVDPMVPGKKITSIYGFCDIRQFTDTTECLQEEVMVYVNKLGDIVHGCTHAYYGMANKNVGDAFLLSWKVCDGELEGYTHFTDMPSEVTRKEANKLRCPPNAGAGSKRRQITPTEMADSALTAFLKCIVDLHNANATGTLAEYATYPRVLARFGENFSVKMGFGMHVGWAVEGAIGSAFKIDATYLSAAVEMSDRLEAGSKIFGTPLNISHWLVALLSPAARRYLRKLDRIKVAGCPVPMTVYTMDVINFIPGCLTPIIDDKGAQMPVDFDADSTYAALQNGLHPNFKETYTTGINAYLDGDWRRARVNLDEALALKPDDGPTCTLLRFMGQTGFEAPAGWRGWREIEGY